MHIPDLLSSSQPFFSDQLRRRTDQLRSGIVKANHDTQFARAAPELSIFRDATAHRVDGMDGDSLSEAFRQTVQFTYYDSYVPWIKMLSQSQQKASAITDLLAPGLPDCLTYSSSTSGGIAKCFPKYNTLSNIRFSNLGSRVVQDPLRSRTKLCVYDLACDRMLVSDEDNSPAKTIYLASASVENLRVGLQLHPDDDGERMDKFVLDHATPFAAGFIRKWPSFLLIHALFALTSKSLESMKMVFISTFVDMMYHLETKFDVVVECIANGTIPDLDGLTDVRHYLEMNISPDPARAADLRRLGRPSSRPGWCAHVWPNLRSVVAVASGPFASSLPLARQYLGPDTMICAPGYGCTEGWIGLPYNPIVLNQFKLCGRCVLEFLDIDKSDSISSLAQMWEVELGRLYEVVITTTDGLWRYRLGDVVEICGFDPTDGVPVVQFVERRNVVIRFPDFMVTEKELRSAMSLVAHDTLVNWTATMDERCMPATIGFFVELAGYQDSVGSLAHSPLPDLALAREGMLNELVRLNANIAWDVRAGSFGKPTIRLVRAGTFSDFLQLKLDEGSRNVGQIKVPVALPKAEYVTWFSERVVHEF